MAEEVERLRSSLEKSDRLVSARDRDIADRDSRLAAANQKIAERDEEIERLESELAERSQTPTENSAPTGKDLPEAADLLNQVKGLLGKKCGSTLKDMQAVVAILRGEEGKGDR